MAGPAKIREQIAEGISVEKIQSVLDAAMNESTPMRVTCPRACSRGYKFDVQTFDAKTALTAAQWAVEQGYGKVPTARAEEIDFAASDPFKMTADQRGALLEKCEAWLEGKAEPPARGTSESS